jgi:hypothetical protein
MQESRRGPNQKQGRHYFAQRTTISGPFGAVVGSFRSCLVPLQFGTYISRVILIGYL